MISIVIVNWNAGSLLEQCIRSLERHAGDSEIIVVDNGSDDGSLDFLSRTHPPVRLQQNETNPGFAAANNTGWKMSGGDPVLFLNPDTECTEGAIQALHATMLAGRDVWAVGGALASPSGRHQSGFNVRAFPTVGSVAAEMLMMDEIWPWNPWTSRYRMSRWDLRSVCEVNQPAAACLMVRRSALESLDGFDESFYPAWFEDVDLCRRIRNGGGRILFQPAAHFLHHGGFSLGRLAPDKFLEYYHTNEIRYFAKHLGSSSAARVRRLVVLGLYLRAVITSIRPIVPGMTRAQSARTFLRVARSLSSAPEADL
jgi:GT2 family glycosyltransferase